MYLTVQGLVVRVSEYNDRDCFLTLLTKEHGRIAVKARNVRRKNSAIAACCQLLTLSEFNLLSTKTAMLSTMLRSQNYLPALGRILTSSLWQPISLRSLS